MLNWEGNSLNHSKLITEQILIQPKGHWEPCNEVGSKSPTNCISATRNLSILRLLRYSHCATLPTACVRPIKKGVIFRQCHNFIKFLVLFLMNYALFNLLIIFPMFLLPLFITITTLLWRYVFIQNLVFISKKILIWSKLTFFPSFVFLSISVCHFELLKN